MVSPHYSGKRPVSKNSKSNRLRALKALGTSALSRLGIHKIILICAENSISVLKFTTVNALTFFRGCLKTFS